MLVYNATIIFCKSEETYTIVLRLTNNVTTVTKPVTGPLQLTSLIVLSIRTDRLGDRRYLHHHSLHYLGRHQFDSHRFFDFFESCRTT
jgi:hypothetical protein